MNKDDLRIFLVLLLAMLSFNACQKEISCEACNEANQPPVARAGADQVITLPTDSTILDGSASTDPDGTIAAFFWTRISGPDSYTIADPDSAVTVVNKLTEGAYLFELKVTDAEGLFSRDTVQIQVAEEAIVSCTPNRSAVNVRVTPVGNLSMPRMHVNLATAGTKILFAGGYTPDDEETSRVDIYDFVTNAWTTAELSDARDGMATATLGTKVFFAGGGHEDFGGQLSSRVDIYDASTNNWSTAELSLPRAGIAAATLGDLVFFAGGSYGDGGATARVDIYNNATNTWSTAMLSEARSYLEATVVGDKIYFAGGINYFASTGAKASKRVDVYDGASSTWSTIADMSVGKGQFASIAVGNNIFWAGGSNEAEGFQNSAHIEIRDIETNLSTYTCLSEPSSILNAVSRGDEIVFSRGATISSRKVDIYNVVTGTWSVGTLSEDIYEREIILANNKVYVVKGNASNEGEQSTMVATLDW